MYNSTEKTPLQNRHTHTHTHTHSRFHSVTRNPLLLSPPRPKGLINNFSRRKIRALGYDLNCSISCQDKKLNLNYYSFYLNICLMTEFSPQQKVLQKHTSVPIEEAGTTFPHYWALPNEICVVIYKRFLESAHITSAHSVRFLHDLSPSRKPLVSVCVFVAYWSLLSVKLHPALREKKNPAETSRTSPASYWSLPQATPLCYSLSSRSDILRKLC